MVTEAQIEIVQDSFAKVVPIAGPASIMFYDRLFEVRPDFRDLFPESMEDQRGKLMSTLATVVQGLHEVDEIIVAVRALGRRHVGYNVKDADYGPVGEALLWTLEQGLGAAWTDDVKEAWIAAYTMLSEQMIDAANEVRAA